MMHIQGKLGSAKFTKYHIVTLLVHVFEHTAPPSTKRKNEVMGDLQVMEEKHQYLLMEAAEKFSDVERICGDAPKQANTITTGVSTEGGVCAVSIQDTSSLLPMAIKMYLSNETRKKAFTNNAFIYILVGVFKHTPKKNDKRGALLETLNTLVEESPGLLSAAAGIDGNYPFSVTTASAVIPITPLSGVGFPVILHDFIRKNYHKISQIVTLFPS